MEGVIYKCEIQDLSGKLYRYTAQGLDDITGNTISNIKANTIMKMFRNADSLVGIQSVDYLIGQSNPS